MTTMSVAQKSSRAAKVLAGAEELVVKQGFKGVTMSAVAQRAHVGKGTPYLYWNTKEDLFLEIIVRSLADVLHDLAVRVRAEPALAVAERLCVALAKAWLGRPLVRAEEQAAALELLLIGYFAAQTRTISPDMAEDRAGVLGMSISAMLQASQPTKADSVPLADRVSDLLDEYARQLQNAQAEHRRE